MGTFSFNKKEEAHKVAYQSSEKGDGTRKLSNDHEEDSESQTGNYLSKTQYIHHPPENIAMDYEKGEQSDNNSKEHLSLLLVSQQNKEVP